MAQRESHTFVCWIQLHFEHDIKSACRIKRDAYKTEKKSSYNTVFAEDKLKYN